MKFYRIANYCNPSIIQLLRQKYLPTPRCWMWNAIEEYYDLPKPEKITHSLSKVTLPSDWKILIGLTNPRYSTIVDHHGQQVGTILFYEDSGSYRGSTSFHERRLRELGIIAHVSI